ncbi:hypothetical protein [Gallaecimonas mangrovi]|uniref:hypothetical protein n=1 Tax=Gallaecimonas mangrovi TaxID=2291597 RepID=UPI00126012D3|nr:hypothetical protein [Gallaecimonas mangrovi]
MAKQIKLDLGAMLKEAWQGAARFDRGLIAPFLMLVGITMILGVVMVELMEHLGWTLHDLQGQTLLQLILTVMLAPALVGLQLIALQQVVGLRPPMQMLWHWYRVGPVLSLTALMSLAIVNIGMMLFIVPGLFLQIALTPVLMLVADKGMSPFTAIKISVLVCVRYFVGFLLCQLLSILAVLVSAVTLGIASLWLVPLLMRFQAILYRELFGVRLKLATGNSQAMFNA